MGLASEDTKGKAGWISAEGFRQQRGRGLLAMVGSGCAVVRSQSPLPKKSPLPFRARPEGARWVWVGHHQVGLGGHRLPLSFGKSAGTASLPAVFLDPGPSGSDRCLAVRGGVGTCTHHDRVTRRSLPSFPHCLPRVPPPADWGLPGSVPTECQIPGPHSTRPSGWASSTDIF